MPEENEEQIEVNPNVVNEITLPELPEDHPEPIVNNTINPLTGGNNNAWMNEALHEAMQHYQQVLNGNLHINAEIYDDDYFEYSNRPISSRRLKKSIQNEVILLKKYGYTDYFEKNDGLRLKYYKIDNNIVPLISFTTTNLNPNPKSNIFKITTDQDNKHILKSFSVSDMRVLSLTSEVYTISDEDKIKNLAFVKIKNYKESSKMFGYGKIKKQMFEESKDIQKDNGFNVLKTIKGKLFKIDAILDNFDCKKDKSRRDVFQIVYGDKKFKFLYSDLELVYPDVKELTKGLNMPKDRTIKKGSNVIIKDSNTKGVVVERLQPLGAKKYFKVKCENKIKIMNNKQLKLI